MARGAISKRRNRLAGWFIVWIAIGAGAIAGGLRQTEVLCAAASHENAHEAIRSGNSTDDKYQDAGDPRIAVMYGLAQADEPKADEDKNASTRSAEDGFYRSVLCGTNATDWALVFFTYCLVVVGFSQIRSNERTVRDLERAILVCGPTNFVVLPGRTKFQLQIKNTGRSGAIVKEMYAACSVAEPKGSPRYETPPGTVVETEIGVDSGFDSPFSNVFETDVDGPQYVFGYISYDDIFRRRHVNRFCLFIDTAKSDFRTAGSPAWSDWD